MAVLNGSRLRTKTKTSMAATEFVTVATTEDIPVGERAVVELGRHWVVIFNVDGQFHALDGICPHQGGPLGKGALAGCIITCPWHGFQFDVTTGQHQTSKSLVHPRFPVKVENGQVWVDIES